MRFSSPTIATFVCLALYLALLGALAGGMFYARHRVLSDLGSAGAAEQWQEWKKDVERQTASSPAPARRVPKSNEPPLLVLMRDSFLAVLTVTLAIFSVLFWFLALLLRGSSRRAPSRRDADLT
ncbi:MAG: hypothetical protein HYS13_18930 [Planctomycetia bacterium]|nr:hypothetical protein [Planctomycetia bacterium]